MNRKQEEGKAVAEALRFVKPLAPGIHKGYPYRSYRADSAIACSDIFRWVSGPLKQRRYLLLGDAFHKKTLEPHTYDNDFVVTPKDWKIDYKHKDQREAYLAFQAENPGRVALRPFEQRMIDSWVERIREDEFARTIVFDAKGPNEVVACWDLFGQGMLSKGRLDGVRSPNVLFDLKTSSEMSRENFERKIWKYRYHCAAAYYHDLWRENTDEELTFVWVVVSKEVPEVWVIICKPEWLEAGRKHYQDVGSLYVTAKKGGITL